MNHDNIDPEALYWATFNRCQFRIPGEAIIDIAQPGQNDDAVAYWAPRINRFEWPENPWSPTEEAIRAELEECGAWEPEELDDDESNWERLVWIAAHNVAEDEERDCSDPVEPAAA